MKMLKIILFTILSLIIVALAVLFFLIRDISGSALPQYDGELILKGLQDEVSVYRDERGIPHIYGVNEHDLYMVTGYIMAQERMWQMDLIRRATTGRLSEIFGEDYVNTDLFLRALRIPQKSKMIIENSESDMLACVSAYVDGVNHYIESAGKKLPPEFRILGYKPDPWTMEDCANIIGYMGWDLAKNNMNGDLFIYKLIQKIGREEAIRLIPYYNIKGEFVYPDFKIDEALLAAAGDFVNSADKVKGLGITPFTGSNNWAVSGERSSTGKPLLSNDMHLGLSSPGIWIQMHLVIPGEMNITGVIVPGEPFIIAGHNERIAWGETNLMVDDIDLYLEMTNPEKTKYYCDGEWHDIRTVDETIKVKKGDDQVLQLRFTHRGPIISGFRDVEGADLSMRWSGNDMSNELMTGYLLTKASGWDDFREAISWFNTASQNFAYADVDGNIGLHAGGGIPIRELHGSFIMPGDSSRYDWKGYVPKDQLPYSFNPGYGAVSSANNKTVDADYPYYIGTYYTMPYRINRIREMISSAVVFSVDDFKRMITDRHSNYAAKLTPLIINAVEGLSDLSEQENRVFEGIREWDYDMGPDIIMPTFFDHFLKILASKLLSDELGELFKGMNGTIRDYYLLGIIRGDHDLYIDDTGTENTETLNEILIASFRETVTLLTEKYSADTSKWLWGDIHQFTASHPMGSIRVLDRLFGFNVGPFRVGGSNHTVSTYSYSGEFVVDHGASERHVFNTADWDDSYTVIPTGISGLPASEFYCSQILTYCEDRFYRDHFSLQAVKEAQKYLLLLKPPA
ncbi:MAG TPA: penicillin acylase family protein [Bacteroidales bacterium]|nr:penicillin acylase family protein [Bacteroidales bacterium]